MHYEKCRPEDLNPQPTDYKSVALPIELDRHIVIRFLFEIIISLYFGSLHLLAYSKMFDASGLLVAYSVDVVLVALPIELDRHIVIRFLFEIIILLYFGSLHLLAYSKMFDASGLLVAYSADVVLVALPIELDRHIVIRFLFEII